MIVHRLGQDTYVSFDWTDDTDVAIPVTSVEWLIDDADASGDAPVTLNDVYAVEVHFPAALELTPGNHTYKLTAVATDTGDATVLSQGMLRVKP